MNIKCSLIPVLHSVAPHIRLIRQDQRRRHAVHRCPRGLIVMADGCRHDEDVLERHICIFQDLICEDRAAVRMIVPVDAVAYIMHIPGDLCKLCLMLAISQFL